MSVTSEQSAVQASVAASFQQLSGLEGREYYDTWLATQCRIIPGTYFGVLVMRSENDGQYRPVSIWPESATDMDNVSELIEQAIEQEYGLITPLEDSSSETGADYALGLPVTIDGSIDAVVAINIHISDKKDLKSAMQQLQWGCSWIELQKKKELAEKSGTVNEQLKTSVDILARVFAEESSAAANMGLVTELNILMREGQYRIHQEPICSGRSDLS